MDPHHRWYPGFNPYSSDESSPELSPHPNSEASRSQTPSPSHRAQRQFSPQRESNDNPLYEDARPISPTRQGIPNDNPLYRNDPFQSSERIYMTEFLLAKAPRQSYSSQQSQEEAGKSVAEHEHVHEPQEHPPRNLNRRYSNEWSSPGPSSQEQRAKASTSQQRPSPNCRREKYNRPECVTDLVAAVRSDPKLLKGEMRKGGREPRIPGDPDRYFAPRKGDIIVHAQPTRETEGKLVEYFDEGRVHYLEPGDKLVRVKYDNHKIPDHLMITSKLYMSCSPDWVYLGKSVQTIKTA